MFSTCMIYFIQPTVIAVFSTWMIYFIPPTVSSSQFDATSSSWYVVCFLLSAFIICDQK